MEKNSKLLFFFIANPQRTPRVYMVIIDAKIVCTKKKTAARGVTAAPELIMLPIKPQM